MDAYAVTNMLLDLLGRLPGWIATGYFWSLVLRLRNPRACWLAWMAILPASELLTLMPPASTLPVTITYTFVLPVLASTGKLGRRVLVVCLTFAVQMLGELAGSAYLAATGFYQMSLFRDVMDHPALYATTQIIMFTTMIAGYYAVFCLMRKSPESPDLPTQPWIFGPLVLMCLLMAILVAVAENMYSAAYVPSWLNLGLFVVLLVDFLLIVLSARQADRRFEQELEMRRLQAALDEGSRAYELASRQIERAAHFRHDFRNRLQTVDALVGMGDFERARGMVAQMRDEAQAWAQLENDKKDC